LQERFLKHSVKNSTVLLEMRCTSQPRVVGQLAKVIANLRYCYLDTPFPSISICIRNDFDGALHYTGRYSLISIVVALPTPPCISPGPQQDSFFLTSSFIPSLQHSPSLPLGLLPSFCAFFTQSSSSILSTCPKHLACFFPANLPHRG
jgi:hypothetical protein